MLVTRGLGRKSTSTSLVASFGLGTVQLQGEPPAEPQKSLLIFKTRKRKFR